MQAGTIHSFLNSPLGFAIFFVTLWCALSLVVSIWSGWFTLSRHFRKQSEPYGETRSAGPLFYTIRMRFRCRYENAMRLTAAEDALCLSMLFLFRIGHPPISIPWMEIQFGRTKFLWRRYVVLTLGEKERIPLRISERLARKLGILERMPADEPSPKLKA
jgi:hypothetical protein